MIKIGVLGCGNMGGAILRGWATSPELSGKVALYVYDRHAEVCACNAGIATTVSSALELARESDCILLAVKPQQLPEILSTLKAELDSSKLLISIAAGLTIARLKELTGRKSPLVRVMPNIPAMVGQGIFGLCFDDPALTPEQSEWVEKLFAAIGLTMTLPEEKFNAFTALSGGGPAYIFYMLDALVEAGVGLGITRQDSLDLVMAVAKGSIALAESSTQPMAALREQVCSPGGTTIEAINHFERNAMRGHIIDAIAMACEKGKKLG